MYGFDALVEYAFNDATLKKEKFIVLAITFSEVLVVPDKFEQALDDGASVEQAVEASVINQCIPVLQKITIRKDIKLFLYSSTLKATKHAIKDAFEHLYGIEFDYVEATKLNYPPLKSTQDFSKKPYYSILLDSKAGFEIDDWVDLLEGINKNFIIPGKNGDN